MDLFTIRIYGIVVLGVALLAMWIGGKYELGFLLNVGFLAMGVLIGTYPIFSLEEGRRKRREEVLVLSIFHELANRVARCCFDFENPWKAYHRQPQNMVISRLQRFAPDLPVIYPAVAEKIATFRSEAVQGIILFYVFLAAWQRDIECTADECKRQSHPVPPEDVHRLARRLRQTLKPGHDILEKLSGQVPNAEQ